MTSPLSSFTSPLSFPNLGLVRFPAVVVDADVRAEIGVSPQASNTVVLARAAWAGYLRLREAGRFAGISEEQVRARLRSEFETFARTGVIDYLLLVWDINRWSDKQGIVRGYGRGSVGGSLTMYCLGVSRVNPVKHNLDFPRFISEARLKPVIKGGVVWVEGKTAPDVDCDYEYLRRAEVVSYIESRYPGRVAKISTRLELTGKMALKDTLKTYLLYSDEEARAISDHVEVRFGKVQSLVETQEGDKVIPAARDNPGLKEWLAKDPCHEEAYAIAVQLEGLTVAHGQHPSGVFISYDELDGRIPLETSRSGDTTTSFDMETVAGLGIKVDILGLRTLDLVARTARIAGIRIEDLDVEDPSIYQYLQTHSTYLGLFQIAEGLTKEATIKIGPRHVEDLSVVLAISRPGAMSSIPRFQRYVKTGEIEPFYPAIDEVLKPTGGALVMQEQITQVCRDVCGLSGVDADQVRAAIGKKKVEEMVKWESAVREGARLRGVPDSVIDSFWSTCRASADYLFNLAHSCEYAYLTAATTYLKAHHPLPFYLTMLQLSREEPNPTEVMNAVIAEMRESGFQVLPPDILKSGVDFAIEGDKGIRFGLASIKGVSEATLSKLTSIKQSFCSRFQVFEAARAAKVPVNVLTSLIYSGCLDTGGAPRSYYALNAQLYGLLTDREKPLVHRLAPEYQDDLLALLKALPTRTDEKGRPLIKPSRLDTLRRDYSSYWSMYKANSQNEELTAYLFERELLGFSYTSSLYGCYSKRVEGLTRLKDAVKRDGGESPTDGSQPTEAPAARPKSVRVVAIIGEVKRHLSKKDGTPYLKVRLVDDEASVPAMVYGQRVGECEAGNGRLPKEGDIVICTADLSREGSMLFLSGVTLQETPVVLKHTQASVPV